MEGEEGEDEDEEEDEEDEMEKFEDALENLKITENAPRAAAVSVAVGA